MLVKRLKLDLGNTQNEYIRIHQLSGIHPLGDDLIEDHAL